MLERRAVRTESRASSRQSLSTCCHEEDTFFDNSSSIPERSCSSSTSSKRSSGGLNARVVITVDSSGVLEFPIASQELNIGHLPLPSVQTTWEDIDQQLNGLLNDYTRKIDPGNKLGSLNDSIIGYQVDENNTRDMIHNTTPSHPSSDLITSTSLIKLKLKGAAQGSMDSLVLESLFPSEILQQLLQLLMKNSRRIVINGPAGIGKSNLSKYLAKYLAGKKGINQEQLRNFSFPINEYEKQFDQAKKDLEDLLKLGADNIVMIDNTPSKAVDVLCEAFDSADKFFSEKTSGESQGPFVIITLNRTANVKLQKLQVEHNVRIFSLYCQMELIKGKFIFVFQNIFLLKKVNLTFRLFPIKVVALKIKSI